MRKILLALLSLVLFSCDSSSLSTSGGNDGEGMVAIQVDMGPVGVLARSLAMTPKRLVLAFRSSDNKTKFDTVSVSASGSSLVSYKLATGVDWNLDISILDQLDSVLYSGSKSFRVTSSGSTLQVVEITVGANYSSMSLVFPILDSVSRVLVRIDGQVWGDSSLTPGSRRGDTVRIDRDYLSASPSGVSHRYELQVRGKKMGVDTLLYGLDTSLSIHSGKKEGFALKLRWVGPDTTPTSSQSFFITMGTVGQALISTTYGSGSAVPQPDADFGIPWLKSTFQTFQDPRDGTVYKTVTLFGHTWMAEDLRYSGPDGALGRCIANSPDSCLKYGRMYRWSEALGIAAKFDTSWLDTSIFHDADLRVQGICPPGWMIPSSADAQTLLSAGGSVAGALKSNGGWADIAANTTGNGTDNYGFRALPAGEIPRDGTFSTGYMFMFQTGREVSATQVWVDYIRYTSGIGLYSSSNKTSALPVRCFQP
jgi:uncharacterized protein (TIGR02145 family)